MRFATSILVLVSLSNLTAATFWVTPKAADQKSVPFRGANTDSWSDTVPGNNPLEYCYEDHAADILQLDFVDIDPNPPSAYLYPNPQEESRLANTADLVHHRGAIVIIQGAGTTSEDIEEGAYVQVQVKLGIVTILKTTADFCEQVKDADLECPIEKGKVIVKKEFTLPEGIPNGKWTVRADVYSKDEKRITCVTASVIFKSPDGKEKDL